MFTYQGGEKVEGGFYLNRRTFEVAVINREGVLEGGPGEAYARVPTLFVLALAPALGAAFAMFLPFIGIAMALDLGARKLWRRVTPS